MTRTLSQFGWAAAALLAVLNGSVAASANDLVCSRVYTLNADFDEGTLLNVNHNIPDQLQLNTETKPFPFIWVACSARGTVVRIDVNTGTILGEYLSAPAGRPHNPSRTTVDLNGNVWVSNRDEADGIGGVPHGSVVKIGLVIGGTRVDAGGNPDPNGEYLKPPFLYSTAVDRDGDGLIKTSRGLGDVRPWPDFGDGGGGGGGGAALVQDADDECILIYQRLPDAPNARHVSVTKDNDVWVGGYPFAQRMFHKLSGIDGSILASFDARPFGAGGYGGFIDANNVLWSASISQNSLLRYDLNLMAGMAIPINQSYGLGVDSAGFVWNAMWTMNTVAKLSPAGVMQAGFPVPTGGSCSRGVAVTLADNHVWIANSCTHTVTRLDNAGNLLKSIAVGNTPTGVAVDANGKVWVTCLGSDTAERIDPTVGLGTVDLVVNLGPGAAPYNYSDMTGNLILGVVQQGTWTVVHDSLVAGTDWGTVSWTSTEPAGTSIKARVRAADTIAGLPGIPFVDVENGVNFCDKGVAGRYIEIQAVFSRQPGIQETPILYDLTVQCCNRPPVALCQDITVCTDPGTCEATVEAADVDAGSYDPDGDPITMTIAPPGPYPLGQTIVVLTVTDPLGESDSCEATITVVDCEAPSVECVPTTNPAGKVVPPAGNNPKSGQNPDGFYQLLAADNCDPNPAIYVADSASAFMAGPFQSGDKVKITQAPGVKPTQKPGAGVIVAHILLKGDAVVVAVDASGNMARCMCLVPPPPK